MEAEQKNLTFQEKHAERLKRLKEIHLKRNESRQLNHQEVVEEDRRKQLPNNWEARKRKAEWILKDEEQRQKALEEGEDYERVKMLNMTVAEAEKFNKKKKNPDVGFSDYQQATARQYNRLVKQMKPDMSKYEEQKKKLGPAFYGDQKTILQGLHSDRPEAVDKMVEDLEKQISKREKYSRRRTHNDDADIDYINERNMKFNKKLERFYGEHTAEIKQNLERGTAI
ncbi:pre-mRNA-splicing factor syf2 [Diaphorina citri]|uniref:Pre-mRNA-splicing factor SYF2 n=1 Tax=Diaphorina citri TaxID=121845 RepID=A0A1S3DIN4_DIACI|nr:pre-mRNA-splicing factor syf2 [Diaphorina citri]